MDSPQSSAGSPHRRNNMHNYSLDDSPDDPIMSDGQQRESSFDRHDQTVFDLSMDYDDDDQVLLDWEQYAGMKRVKCCGLDCTRLVTSLPCASYLPPGWWYQLTRSQKRLFWWICGGVLTALVIILAIIALPGSSPAATADNASDLLSNSTRTAFLNQYSYCQWDQWRLPTEIRPTAYNISLNVQLEEPFTVTGAAQIQLAVEEDTPCVVLHTSRMNISAVSLLGQAEPGLIHAVNDTNEQMILSFDSLLPRTQATVSIAFDYSLRPGLEGLYRSQFTAAGGHSQTLATTFLFPVNARKVFPCLDEPSLKATFDISLTTTTGLTALSNMPVIASEDLPTGLTTTHFATSPPMSTYLVALIMGNLTNVSTTVPHPDPTQPDRKVSIYGTPDRAGNLATALEITSKVLPAFESLFGIPFTLPKLDLIAIPDFAAGAMENWGLITYRETALLLDPQHASLRDIRSVANVIAHEMTHQWFGDLVTCDYWGELWLNEGFATYFENYGATAARPEFRFYDTFYADQSSYGQRVDAKNVSTHALATITGVDSIGRVESFFDAISYQKGGSVIRMMRAYLNSRRINQEQYGLRRSLLQGDDTDKFIASLQKYLQANQLGTGTSQKLWETVSQQTGLPVARWMQQWTYSGGFPLVSAAMQGSQVMVSQVPFTSQGPGVCDPTNTTGTPPWWIPLPFISSTVSSLDWSSQLDTCVGGMTINTASGTEWVKLNAGQYGFYRVNYTESMWAQLATAAGVSNGGGTVLGSEDVAGLLDDAYQLSRGGQLSITVYLDLIRSLAKRPEPLVSAWLVGASPLVQIYQSLSMTEGEASCAAQWAAFVQQNISTPAVANVTAGATRGISISGTISGTEAESESLRLLRPTLLSLAGYFNTSTVSQEAVQLLQDNSNNVLGIDPDVRQLVYTQAVANGGTTSYNTMKTLYLAATDPSEKERNLVALTYARQADLRQQTLDMVLDPSVRSQDTLSLLSGVAGRSNAAAHAAWTFLTQNWMAVYEKLGGDNEASRMMGKATQAVASHFAAQPQIDAVNDLYATHEEYLSERSYFDNSIDSIQANIQWLQSNAERVCTWLQQT